MVQLTHPLQEDEHLPGGSYELLQKLGLHQDTRLDKLRLEGVEAQKLQQSRRPGSRLPAPGL